MSEEPENKHLLREMVFAATSGESSDFDADCILYEILKHQAMQDSPTILIAALVLLFVLHTVVASNLLIRHAYRIANWRIALIKSLFGHLLVLVAASALTYAFVVAANLVSSMFSFSGLIFATPIVFLLFYWFALDRLIIHLSTFRGRRNLRSRLRHRIAYLTVLPTAVICIGITSAPLILRAITPSTAPSEKPIQEVSKIEAMNLGGFHELS